MSENHHDLLREIQAYESKESNHETSDIHDKTNTHHSNTNTNIHDTTTPTQTSNPDTDPSTSTSTSTSTPTSTPTPTSTSTSTSTSRLVIKKRSHHDDDIHERVHKDARINQQTSRQRQHHHKQHKQQHKQQQHKHPHSSQHQSSRPHYHARRNKHKLPAAVKSPEEKKAYYTLCDMTYDKVAFELCGRMNEKNTSLIYAIVKHMGIRTAVDTWYRVQEIQAQGGMMLETRKKKGGEIETQTTSSSSSILAFGQPSMRPALKPYQPPRPAEFMMDDTADITSTPTPDATTTKATATESHVQSTSTSPSLSPSASASPSASELPEIEIDETDTITEDKSVEVDAETVVTATDTTTSTDATATATATATTTAATDIDPSSTTGTTVTATDAPVRPRVRSKSRRKQRHVVRPARGARTDGGIFIKLIRDSISADQWQTINQHHKQHMQLIKANIAIKDVEMTTAEEKNTAPVTSQEETKEITTVFTFAPEGGGVAITSTFTSTPLDLPIIDSSTSSSFSLAPGLAVFSASSLNAMT